MNKNFNFFSRNNSFSKCPCFPFRSKVNSKILPFDSSTLQQLFYKLCAHQQLLEVNTKMKLMS